MRFKIILTIILFGLVLFYCQQACALPKAWRLVCDPRHLSEDSELHIILPLKHGRYISIQGPDGVFHFLIKEGEVRYPIGLKAEEFEKAGRLSLPVKSLLGITAVRGRSDQFEPVFTLPGTYLIRVGNKLESDSPEAFQTTIFCTVRFKKSHNRYQ